MNQVKNLIKKIKENHIEEYTAGCAYYTILAFIPLMMLILSLTKYVGINEQALFSIFNEWIPKSILNDAIMGIVKEVYSKSVGTITLSAIFVLLAAGKGFFALCKGLNAAYEVEEEKRYLHFRIRAIISTIIFIFAIVLSLLVLVFGNSIYLMLQEKFHIFSSLFYVVLKIKLFISTMILSILFTMMYQLIPQHHYPLKKQIPGAIIASLLCNMISIFYSIYVDVFQGFSIMYGSLTTIVLAMMWLYACMYSILLGAVINKEWSRRDEKLYKLT